MCANTRHSRSSWVTREGAGVFNLEELGRHQPIREGGAASPARGAAAPSRAGAPVRALTQETPPAVTSA